jgi:hypothetical protein
VNNNYYKTKNGTCILCQATSCNHHLYTIDGELLNTALSSSNTTLKEFYFYLQHSKKFDNIFHKEFTYNVYQNRNHTAVSFLEKCGDSLKDKKFKYNTSNDYEDVLFPILKLLQDFVKDRDTGLNIILNNYVNQETVARKSIMFSDDYLYINNISNIVDLVLMKNEEFNKVIGSYKEKKYFIYNNSLQIRERFFYESKNKPFHLLFKDIFVEFFGGLLFNEKNFINKKNAEIIFGAIAYFTKLNKGHTYPVNFNTRKSCNILYSQYKIIKYHNKITKHNEIQVAAINDFLYNFYYYFDL